MKPSCLLSVVLNRNSISNEYNYDALSVLWSGSRHRHLYIPDLGFGDSAWIPVQEEAVHEA